MQAGKDLSTLAAELQRRADARQDVLADTRQVEIEGDSLLLPLLNRPVSHYKITGHTHGQIAEYTGVPKAYYDRLKAEQPRLFKQNVETWFRAKAEQRLVR